MAWQNQPDYGAIQYAQDRENDARVEKQQRLDRYNAQLADAFNTAPAYGKNYAHSIGLNPDDPGIAQIIAQITGNIQSNLPQDQDSTINPHSYFSPEAFGEGVADFQSRGRQASNMQVANAFKPGMENTLLPDSSIDSIVDQIISEQRGLANTTLDYQSKRGLLTPQGTDQANKSLENQSQAARSTVSGLAQGALDVDRSSLRDIIAEAGSAANNWTLGTSPFDVSPYQSRINETAQRESAGFGGDVRAALGNTQLFDIPSIVAQAGTAQGAQNLNVGNGVVGPDKKKQTNRGLGSQGGGF